MIVHTCKLSCPAFPKFSSNVITLGHPRALFSMACRRRMETNLSSVHVDTSHLSTSFSLSLVHKHSLNLRVPLVSNRVCGLYILYFSTPPLWSLLYNFLPDLVFVYFDTVSITASLVHRHSLTHSHACVCGMRAPSRFPPCWLQRFSPSLLK